MQRKTSADSPERFGAPWGTRLITTSIGFSVLIVGVAVYELKRGGSLIGAVIPIAILVGSALSTVRGYEITPKHIAVKRLIWSTYIGRHNLEDASVIDMRALKHGWRLFGNGGLFAFAGIFSSETLGNYRAYVTGGEQGVLLRFTTRKVVLTPDDPGRFVRLLSNPRP